MRGDDDKIRLLIKLSVFTEFFVRAFGFAMLDMQIPIKQYQIIKPRYQYIHSFAKCNIFIFRYKQRLE